MNCWTIVTLLKPDKDAFFLAKIQLKQFLAIHPEFWPAVYSGINKTPRSRQDLQKKIRFLTLRLNLVSQL
jgi:hypothetical protein